MITIDRLVKEEKDTDEERIDNSLQSLSAFRENPAWVLLGEPGAGKSTSLKYEAEVCGEEHRYLSIAEFLYEYSEEELKGKTLFLDGLDEIRASSNNNGTIFLQVKANLRKLGTPKFRIACRAADWLGASDSEDIKSASQNNKIARLLLITLDREDIVSILQENYDIADPNAFVEKAEKLGVYHLLENPQTLEMLVKAVRGDQWPESRIETFQLACEKLVEEANRRHRDQKRGSAISKEQLLDMAGQLFATMLLSDKDGIALDQDTATQRFPYLDDYLLSSKDVAYEVIHRNLYRLEREECVKPAHRSIAEYLAATWLAQQIDKKGLPLGRVLTMLIGRDGRTISGLRGLYGWLAIQCKTARAKLIQADALTVVAYGDAKLLPEADKRSILSGLRKEAVEYSAFHRDIQPTTPFGALADPSLIDDFTTALVSTSRDNATQSYVDCLLTILKEGEPIPLFSDQLLMIIRDESWWDIVRMDALKSWLYIENLADEARALLDDIDQNRVCDTEDELAGVLLRYLYPDYLPVKNLINYLHTPKRDHLTGAYVLFWRYKFAEECSESDLGTTLEWLITNPDIVETVRQNFHLRQVVSRLVTRCIVAHGDKATDENIYKWISLGSSKYYDSNLEASDREAINGWLADRPDRYKGLLHYYIESNRGEQRIFTYEFWSLIPGATVPDDFGIWCLEQATSVENEAVTKVYLFEAIGTIRNQRGNNGIKLEDIENWAEEDEHRQKWLRSYLVCEIEDWRSEHAERRDNDKNTYDRQRRERTHNIVKYMSVVRDGVANAYIMYELAGVWQDLYFNVNGESIEARFEDYSENGSELLDAARQGFIASPKRDNLPSVDEIIDLSLKNQEHYIRRPSLIGMEIRWEQGGSAIESLPDEALECMIAFRLTYGCEQTPNWFTYLVKVRPELVAEVYAQYATVLLKAKKSHIDSLYLIETDSAYGLVACQVVPIILKKFPLRVKLEQLYCLEHLLKSALRYRMEALPIIVKEKLSKRSIGMSQKVYWLATGMLLDKSQYERVLWEFVDESQSRLNYLSGFLTSRYGEATQEFELSVYTIGKLIAKLTPHAELDWSKGDGRVTDAMNQGDYVRALIRRLTNMATTQAEDEIIRLLKLPAMEELKFTLEDARHQIRQKRREISFSFLSLTEVAKVLANQEPTIVADLAALVLYHLNDIANEIRQENDDGFSKFWNIDQYRKPVNKRVENACRDELLFRFRGKLDPFGIDCQPEGDYANDKRADIRISYQNKFEMPVEIKRDDNDSLWNAPQSQLIQQYSISPKANGYGIYLVLWFGKGGIAKAEDGRKNPQNPRELRHRLEDLLNAEERARIMVQVLDVSWP